MAAQDQYDLLSPISDLGLVRFLVADLHDDLLGKVARFRQLADLSEMLGSRGTMLPGGEIAYAAWTEARSSFIHGNYMATVLLCQGLAEQMLAAELSLALNDEKLPQRLTFPETLDRSVRRGIIGEQDAADLRRLMALRNPLSHYRGIDDPTNLSRRAMDSNEPAQNHLLSDASFAIRMAIRLLALPLFRLDN